MVTVRRMACCLLPLFLGLACDAQSVIRTIYNSGVVVNPSSGGFGSLGGRGPKVLMLGDVDGDWRSDWVFSAENASLVPTVGTIGMARVITSQGPVAYYNVSASSGVFGTGLGAGADVTGDGVPDFVVGGSAGPGAVRLYSGADGSFVRSLLGATVGDYFGEGCLLADCNGDGYSDVIGSSVDAQSPFGGRTTYWSAQSGRDGALLWAAYGSGSVLLVNLGDVNGDGRDDIASGTQIYSGHDGSLIRQCVPSVSITAGPVVAAPAGDMDGDGIQDLLFSSAGYSSPGLTERGYVGIFSAATGAILREHFGVQAGDKFGLGIAGGFYADNDDVPDYAIRAKRTVQWTLWNGRVEIRSGATGAVLQVWQTPNQEQEGALANAGDSDGDGTDELLIGSEYNNVACNGCGAVFVYQVVAGPAGSVRNYGKGCPDSSNRLPTASVTGRPRLGRTIQLRLRAAPANSLVVAVAGDPASIDLAGIGAPGCMGHVAPVVWLAAATDAVGRASLPVVIPNTASLVGIDFRHQWIAFDAHANALGIVTSTAARTVVGS